MAISPLDLIPPDNTGSDTLQRYAYQAQLLVPYCLDCGAQGKVVAILAEHFEDIVIEYPASWHFIQVKTRNQNLGPWKLSDALDGIKSLWRTYESLRQITGLISSYALFLEGAIARNDLLNNLVPLEGEQTVPPNLQPNLIIKVMNELGIAESDCKEFLSRTTVQANQPTRQDVAARNMRFLSQMATAATSVEIEIVYQRLVNRILDAMAADCLASEIPAYIANPNTANLSYKVDKKRLTRDVIKGLLGSLALGPSLLLRRLVEPSMSCPTNLEMKLLTAGAPASVISDAKMLRANATVREVEILAASYDDVVLEDVRNRLIVLANSIIQKHTAEAKPAVNAYHELLLTLMDRAASCDPNRLFRQDPLFLLGEVCAISDECRIDWGLSHA